MSTQTPFRLTTVSRLRIPLIGAMLVASLTACGSDNEPTAPPSTEPMIALNPTAEDRSSLERAIAAVDSSWATMSAASYAANYSTDTRFTAPTGVVQLGRASVQTAHERLFAGPFRGSRRSSVVDDVLWLAATRAVVERTNDLTGYQFLLPGQQPTLPGILRTRERFIFERRDGTWTIVRSQLTSVPPITP